MNRLKAVGGDWVHIAKLLEEGRPEEAPDMRIGDDNSAIGEWFDSVYRMVMATSKLHLEGDYEKAECAREFARDVCLALIVVAAFPKIEDLPDHRASSNTWGEFDAKTNKK